MKQLLSLASRLGIVVFLIASLCMSALGIYCTRVIFHQIDTEMMARARIPGDLMNRQLLPLRSARDLHAISQLTGETVLLASVADAGGTIRYCSDRNLEETAGPAEQTRRSAPEELYISTPLFSKEGPAGFLRLQMDTSGSAARKKDIAFLFLGGGLFCTLIITLAGSILIRRLTMPRILDAVKCLDEIAAGRSGTCIRSQNPGDELGVLEQSINRMAGLIDARREEDVRLNSELQSAKNDAEKKYILLNTIFDAFADHVYYMDASGKFMTANPACSEFHDRKPDEMIGKTELDLYGEEAGRQFYTRSIRTMTGKETIRSRELHMRPGGQFLYIDTVKSPLIDSSGHVFGLAGVSRDVTEQVENEKELIKAKRAAESANQAKSAFLALMSHEIRTPLNAVLGFAQLLSRDCKTCPTGKNHIDSIIKSGRHLLELINDVLEISRTDNKAIVLTAAGFNFHELLNSLQAVSGHNSDKKTSVKVAFADDLPRFIHADQVKVRQVLINLLGNAAKFTEEGLITVSASAVRENSRLTLTVDVQDTGCGIDPKHAKLIFNPFEQTAASLRSRTGSGLGLALSRRYARAMGGDVILLNSEPGKGSTFRFTFEARPVQEPTESAPEAAPALTGTESANETRVTKDDFSRIPADLRSPLRTAVRMGRVRQMHDAVQAIRPEHPRAADELNRLIQQYQYDRLIQLVSD